MSLAGEVRYCLRALSKSPLFTSVAVVSLALGIGANTAVFSLLNQVVLTLLPVQDPGRLVQLKEAGPVYGSNSGMNSLSYPMYQEFRDRNTAFSSMFCRYSLPLSMSFAGRSERVQGELVSGTYFPTLGVPAAIGRVFNASDDKARSAAPFAVLGYDYWQSRFAADPAIVGKQILVNNHLLTVVGVARSGFKGVQPLFSTQVFVPVMMAQELTQEEKPFDSEGRRWLQVFARLTPGVTLSQAKASLQPIFHNLLEREIHQAWFAHASNYDREQHLRVKLNVMPGGGGQSMAREMLAAPLWAMTAMVGLVLLIACANVANLMLARGATRQKEIAIRLALGAGRTQIISQLLIEALLLAFAGAAAGLLASIWSMDLLNKILPHIEPPVNFDTMPDARVLLFTLATAVLAAVIFGLIPAFQATRPHIASTLKDQAAAVVGGTHTLWRKALVCAQVSLSLLLLIGAGLFVATVNNLRNVNPGFAVDNLLSFSVNPMLSGYDKKRAHLFYSQLQESLSAVPGVQSVALAIVAPLNFDEWDDAITVEGHVAKPGEDIQSWMNYISPGYFATLKIPIYAGRDFTLKDVSGAPKVAIVNEKFAHHYFGTRSPIGRHLGMGSDPGTKTDIAIVGVVRDTKYEDLRKDPPIETYIPYQQFDSATGMTAYIRTSVDASQMFPMLRSAVRGLDSNLPIFDMKTETRQVEDVLVVERLAATLSTAFGILATILAAVGLYGVMAFLVSRRTREIGIRMALGALAGDVLWIVMKEVLLLVSLGIALGLPLALFGLRLLRAQLYGLSPYDPATILLAVGGIVTVAAFSGYLPARRATRVDPVKALRYE
ncbi:MAG: ABC transporter permease [Acidobacteriaceae bacterium]|nr:ABC transporter permease [Acidobacteriaceae bacterium]